MDFDLTALVERRASASSRRRWARAAAVAAACWLLPLSAWASEQILLSSERRIFFTGVASYASLLGHAGSSSLAWDTFDAESGVNQVVSAAGTLSGFRIMLNTAPGAGKSWVFTVRQSGGNTAITCTIAGTATSCQDLTHTVSVSAGNWVALRSDPSGTPTDSAVHWSIRFFSNTAAESLVMGNCGPSASATRYCPADGRRGESATESDVEMVAPTSGTFGSLRVVLTAAPGAATSGKSLAFTVRKNAVDTTTTCTALETATSCNDTTNTFTVVAGDRITLKIVPSATAPTVDRAQFGLKFTADTDGEYILGMTTADPLNNAATEYMHVQAGFFTISGTESDQQDLAQPMLIKNIYARVSSAPGTAGSGKSYAFTLRKNGVDTGLTCTILDTATTCNATTNVTVATDDLLSYKVVPSATAPTATPVKISMLADHSGSTQVLVSSSWNGPSTNATNYYALLGSSDTYGWNATESKVEQVIPTNGTLKFFRLRVNTAPDSGAGTQSYAFTLRKNGVDTAITCTVSETAITCTDTTHAISVAPGDRVSLKSVPIGTGNPTGAGAVQWTFVFESTDMKQSIYLGKADALPQIGTAYLGVAGIDDGIEATETDIEQVVPTSGTFKNLYVKLVTAPGGTTTRVITVTKNQVDTTLTCTVTSAATTCSDTSNSFTVVAGDRIDIKSATTGLSPAATAAAVSLVFESDTEGQWFAAKSSDNALSISGTEYHGLNAMDGLANAIESSTFQLGQSTTLTALYVRLDAAPTGGSMAFTLMVNGSASALTCTITTAGSTCNASGSVAVADGATLSIQVAPTGASGTMLMRVGVLGFNGTAGGGRRRIFVTEE